MFTAFFVLVRILKKIKISAVSEVQ